MSEITIWKGCFIFCFNPDTVSFNTNNLSKDIININSSKPFKSVRINNIDSKLVKEITPGSSSNNLIINLSENASLNSGIYFVSVIYEDGTFSNEKISIIK